MRLFVLVFLLFMHLAASAAAPSVQWLDDGVKYPSVSAACSAYASRHTSSPTYGYIIAVVSTTSDGWCQVSLTDKRPASAGADWVPSRPQLTWILFSSVTACPSGTSALSDGSCTEADTCSSLSGKDTTINWTVGYTRTPNIDADPNWSLVGPANKVPSDGVMCDPTSTCKVVASFSGSMSYQSQSPTAQGLYRVSLDMPAQHLGEKCVPAASDTAGASPNAAQPTCPGAVGEVNGVLGCYGTASSPTRNDVPETKPVKPVAGNPAAGEKPASGEGSGSGGSGRTPTNGDGGPAGGPAGAAGGTGTKPDGTTPKPGEGKEQANCGAPGQPKCQIDETGTPNGADSKGKFLDAVNKAADDQKAAIENASKLKADGWTFTFTLPSGCSALALSAYQVSGQGPLSLDVCKWQPMIHDVMTMVWLICTVWGCINMVGATLRGS